MLPARGETSSGLVDTSSGLDVLHVALAQSTISHPHYLDVASYLPMNPCANSLPTDCDHLNCFPRVFHGILEAAETCNYAGICSWQNHGRSFKIHDKERFEVEILTREFRTKPKFSSFIRQLNLYGFRRLNQKTEDQGSFYHCSFVRGRPDLTCLVRRARTKGTGIRRPVDHSTEPNLIEMPPMVVASERIPAKNTGLKGKRTETSHANGSTTSAKGDMKKDSGHLEAKVEPEQQQQGVVAKATKKPLQGLNVIHYGADIYSEKIVQQKLNATLHGKSAVALDPLEAIQKKSGQKPEHPLFTGQDLSPHPEARKIDDDDDGLSSLSSFDPCEVDVVRAEMEHESWVDDMNEIDYRQVFADDAECLGAGPRF